MSEPTGASDEASDAALAERVRAGDSDAYGELWERHTGAARAAAGSFASLAEPDDLVSEAFLQILRALQRGGGPREAFRPYLYRTIRNLALNRRRTDAPTSLELVPELADDGELENSVMESTVTVRAFRTLPERWQTVLWYTEVEGMQPAEAAPVLGLSPNGVAALAHRAREGLKKAWLQAHVSGSRVPPGCQWTTQRMADYARDALSPAARERFDRHLESCTRCSILVEELDDLGRRLASVLLPTVLGGTAAAALLAHSTGAPQMATAASTYPMPSTALTPTPNAGVAASAGSSRQGLLVAAAVIGVVALGSTAFALDGALNAPQAPAASTSAPEVLEPESKPEARTEATPPAPPPASDPVAPPATEPPPAPPAVAPPVPAPSNPPPNPDITPPTAATIAAPADGSLGNDAHPSIAGAGEPGARVEIERIGGPGDSGVILSTIVPAGGRWSVAPAAPFADGSHSLRITQVDAAGNRSAPSTLTLTIDTVAAPPTVDPVVGPQRYLPTLAGRAEPGAAVDVRWSAGDPVGIVTADADGAWSIALTDPGPVDAAVSVTQTDVAGNQSTASVTESIELLRPAITVPAADAFVASTGGSTVVEVRFSGTPGERAEVLIDGVTTGNIHTLESAPLIRSTMPLADGIHTIAVRYLDPATGAVGSATRVSFTIE
jgi:RNA polymerase sigma factor (sigma-70 family)